MSIKLDTVVRISGLCDLITSPLPCFFIVFDVRFICFLNLRQNNKISAKKRCPVYDTKQHLLAGLLFKISGKYGLLRIPKSTLTGSGSTC